MHSLVVYYVGDNSNWRPWPRRYNPHVGVILLHHDNIYFRNEHCKISTRHGPSLGLSRTKAELNITQETGRSLARDQSAIYRVVQK